MRVWAFAVPAPARAADPPSPGTIWTRCVPPSRTNRTRLVPRAPLTSAAGRGGRYVEGLLRGATGAQREGGADSGRFSLPTALGIQASPLLSPRAAPRAML